VKPHYKRILPVILLIIIGLAGYSAVVGTPPFVDRAFDAQALHYQGAGGDPFLLDGLRQKVIDLATIHQVPLHQLRAALPKADSVLYRGLVRHNLLGRGLKGFQVCAYAYPSTLGILKTKEGRELECAVTDSQGFFTFIGLPRDVETTLVTFRGGFLKLAFTTRITQPSTYQQDYIGSVPVYFVRGLYNRDARYPFCAGGNCADRGEMIFTVVNEARAKDDPNYGYVSPGMYAGNGTPGVTIHVFTDPQQNGSFDSPYSDGLVYSGTMQEDINHNSNGRYSSLLDIFARAGFGSILVRQEYPQLWRTETSSFGLALLKYMKPGIYEAEVVHPSLRCRPTKDAWIGSRPARLRFEVIPGTMGDVRFYCAGTL
jgi:hypothetical protein